MEKHLNKGQETRGDLRESKNHAVSKDCIDHASHFVIRAFSSGGEEEMPPK